MLCRFCRMFSSLYGRRPVRNDALRPATNKNQRNTTVTRFTHAPKLAQYVHGWRVGKRSAHPKVTATDGPGRRTVPVRVKAGELDTLCCRPVNRRRYHVIVVVDGIQRYCCRRSTKQKMMVRLCSSCVGFGGGEFVVRFCSTDARSVALWHVLPASRVVEMNLARIAILHCLDVTVVFIWRRVVQERLPTHAWGGSCSCSASRIRTRPPRLAAAAPRGAARAETSRPLALHAGAPAAGSVTAQPATALPDAVAVRRRPAAAAICALQRRGPGESRARGGRCARASSPDACTRAAGGSRDGLWARSPTSLQRAGRPGPLVVMEANCRSWGKLGAFFHFL